MPPGVTRFRAYAEPNPFSDIQFEVSGVGASGVNSVIETISGSSGAKGYSFCDDKGIWGVTFRTTDGVTDFAIGEFAIRQTCPTITRLGSAAPPASLCGVATTNFPLSSVATLVDVISVPSPLGSNINFSIPLSHRTIGGGWGTWSHGYTGDVYYTNGASSVTVTTPIGTERFRLYAEPNPFSDIVFNISVNGGSPSINETISGSSGAEGFGFCGPVHDITIRTTDGVTDFAIGEFAIAN
jgi:hypothetical protein